MGLSQKGRADCARMDFAHELCVTDPVQSCIVLKNEQRVSR